MNFIACTGDCVYQENGECRLDRALSAGQPNENGCAYYVQKAAIKPQGKPD